MKGSGIHLHLPPELLHLQSVIIVKWRKKCFLSSLHARSFLISHLGIEKCRLLARQCFYWPGIITELSGMAQGCSRCLEHRIQLPDEPLVKQEVPPEVLTKVGTDLFHLYSKNYLLIVDYTSKVFEIFHLDNTSSVSVISSLKVIFSHQGIPSIMISDNGPQYASCKFHDFTNAWEIQRITNSPECPKGSGLAERSIQSIKKHGPISSIARFTYNSLS